MKKYFVMGVVLLLCGIQTASALKPRPIMVEITFLGQTFILTGELER